MKKVNIYTRTSFSGIKKQSGVGLYILEMPTEKGPATLQGSVKLEDMTQNAAELTVIREALKRLKEKVEIDIYTESTYAAAGWTEEWIETWKKNDWLTAKGKEVSNRELWQEIDEMLKGNLFRFHTEEPHPYRKWLKDEVKRG